MSESSPDRRELFDLYRIAMDEYRFQVNLNWSRTQYYLVLNIGIISVATGILQQAQSPSKFLVGALFFAGCVCCVLSIVATSVAKTYYNSISEHKGRIEKRLDLDSLSISTTPEMGGLLRIGRVTTFINVMLVLLAAMDVVGVIVVILR